MALVCIMCTSCVRVVTSSHQEVWHGNITKMDSQGRIDVTNSAGDTRTWMVGDSIDDIFYHVNSGSSERFAVGDEVFIHAKDGNILASKVSIEDGKVINSKLVDYYFSDNSWMWILFSVFCVCVIITFIAFKSDVSGGLFVVGIGVSVFSFFVISMSNVVSPKRIYYQDEGVVTEIVENTVTLDGQKSFNVFSLESFNDEQKTINVGDKVYAYKYSEGEKRNGGTTFLATDKLTEATINTSQVYPEFFLYDIVIWVVELIVAFFLLIGCHLAWDKFFTKKKKLEEC